MNKERMVRYLLLMIVMLIYSHTYSQGCSDAGFCTINSFKPKNLDKSKVLSSQFKIGSFIGSADNDISVYGSYLEYSKQLNNTFSIDAKLTSLAQTGNGISVFGLSDLFVNTNYKAGDNVQLTLGTKLPLSNSNKQYRNLPLPMDYQASLGTIDLIFGIGYTLNKLQLVAAIQQPLTQNNNQFLASSYPLGSTLRSFQSTHQFKRSGDVLFRVSYPIKISEKLSFTPSLLPIYHLGNDTYIDESNVKREIVGSDGLTLNGNAYLDYAINDKNSLQLNIGRPFVVRDARPDGLTRGFIANLEYRIRF